MRTPTCASIRSATARGGTRSGSLLELFVRNAEKVLTRSEILVAVWGYDFGPTSNSLEVYVGYLRRKLEEGDRPRLIHTVRSVGYVMRHEP